jgi:chromosomal replication initiation ATPase DnaA
MNQELRNELVQCYKNNLQNLRILHRTLVNAKIITEDFAVSSGITDIKPNRLVELVQDVFETDIVAKNRKQSTIFARKAAAYILRKYTQLSLNEIAPLIGVGDHTTVIYNIQTASDLMDTEDWYREKLMQIEEDIENYNNFVKK